METIISQYLEAQMTINKLQRKRCMNKSQKIEKKSKIKIKI